MGEEDVLAPPLSDHKRKLEDIEPEAPQPPTCQIPAEPDDHETSLVGEPATSPDVKRPRLDDASGFFFLINQLRTSSSAPLFSHSDTRLSSSS